MLVVTQMKFTADASQAGTWLRYKYARVYIEVKKETGNGEQCNLNSNKIFNIVM